VICNCLYNLRKHNLGRQYDLQKRNIYSCTCWFFQYDDRYRSVIIYKICKQMSSNYESIYFALVVFSYSPLYRINRFLERLRRNMASLHASYLLTLPLTLLIALFIDDISYIIHFHLQSQLRVQSAC
jgi:hypothetical protein